MNTNSAFIKMTVNAMNHMFLEHTFSNPDLSHNDTVEENLALYLSSLVSGAIVEQDLVRDELVELINDAEYLQEMSPLELTQKFNDSIKNIIGYKHQELFQFFEKCVLQSKVVAEYNH